MLECRQNGYAKSVGSDRRREIQKSPWLNGSRYKGSAGRLHRLRLSGAAFRECLSVQSFRLLTGDNAGEGALERAHRGRYFNAVGCS